MRPYKGALWQRAKVCYSKERFRLGKVISHQRSGVTIAIQGGTLKILTLFDGKQNVPASTIIKSVGELLGK